MDVMPPPTRVVFISMRQLLRELICELLKGESGLEVAGTFGNARAALHALSGSRVDLVVVGREGLSDQPCGALLEAFPQCTRATLARRLVTTQSAPPI